MISKMEFTRLFLFLFGIRDKVAMSIGCGFNAVVDMQFFEQATQVSPDRALTDVKLF